ncbi:fumarylacetoacetase [Alcaligenes faecalis]|uniref:fumarylacetoacetase n=1 Tax=Alcaligenes faecalis TaxID=511 RepID=UPI000F0BD35E|nr:fumarylacetoacetase [Alcaligenes faecalis]AYR21437.1 fumarylacetoacetase [Alcaligenes faecalis]
MTRPYLNDTHDPKLQSWVPGANEADNGFPIQNLPFAVARRRDSQEDFRVMVAIGPYALDLGLLASDTPWQGQAADALAACVKPALNELMALGQEYWSALRAALSHDLRQGASAESRLRPMLIERSKLEYALPAHIGDYTDFYISVHHATAIGKQFRPDAPLLPNYKWVPIGYHGRASSIGVSGQQFPRPVGQTRPPEGQEQPNFGPCQRLDFELEMGILIGKGNEAGHRIPIAQADEHVFGLCLFNDWSARDLQAWEYQPLGPFLAKNFASTISPWVVTLEALAPFRRPFNRPESDPQPLPYLQDQANQESGVLDVELEVYLSTEQSRQQKKDPALLSRSNFKEAYWTVAQLVAHHSVNGCNLQTGDLLGTGTLSGPAQGQEGSLLEMNQGGKTAIDLPWGEQRKFLQDQDEIILKGQCRQEGYPTLSFGECAGRVLPAIL